MADSEFAPTNEAISEDTVALILRRAAELDVAHGQRVDLATVKQLASEVGISPAAVDEAFREHVESGVRSSRQQLRRRRVMWAVVSVAAVLTVAILAMALALEVGPLEVIIELLDLR